MSDEATDPESRVARAVSGMVAGGYAIEQDFDGGSARCADCGTRLVAGDEVTAVVLHYEGHTWEMTGVYCRDHGVDTVAAASSERSDEQAVVAGTLEPTGYRDPLGEHHPDAVSLGGVEVLDYSPISYE